LYTLSFDFNSLDWSGWRLIVRTKGCGAKVSSSVEKVSDSAGKLNRDLKWRVQINGIFDSLFSGVGIIFWSDWWVGGCDTGYAKPSSTGASDGID
jgi:hypothetical protein